MESWGIEPRPPGWKSGILSTILRRLVMKSGEKLGLCYNASDILAMKNRFHRIIEKKVVGMRGIEPGSTA